MRITTAIRRPRLTALIAAATLVAAAACGTSPVEPTAPKGGVTAARASAEATNAGGTVDVQARGPVLPWY
jgi:hypothetical protein